MDYLDTKIDEIAYLQKINHEMMDLLHSQLSTVIQFSKRNNIPLDRLYQTISIIRQSGHILDHDQPQGNRENNDRRDNITLKQ